MLSPTLGGKHGNRPSEFSRVHSLTGDIPGDGYIFGTFGNLINLININDANLSFLHIVICRLQQTYQNIFNIIADITRFRQRRRITDRKGNIQFFGQNPGQQCLARTSRPDQQNIALLDLYFRRQFVSRGDILQAFIMIVNRNRKNTLDPFLTNPY